MPGPPPTPTDVLRARGSKLARGRAGEPQPPRTAPKCPAHLSAEAKVEFKRITRLLAAVGTLTSADGDALALYCVSYCRWQAAEKELAESGDVIKSPNGYPIQNPYLAIANRAAAQCFKILQRFGLTPADRTRVRVTTPQAKPSGLSDFKLNTPVLRIAP